MLAVDWCHIGARFEFDTRSNGLESHRLEHRGHLSGRLQQHGKRKILALLEIINNTKVNKQKNNLFIISIEYDSEYNSVDECHRRVAIIDRYSTRKRPYFVATAQQRNVSL